MEPKIPPAPKILPESKSRPQMHAHLIVGIDPGATVGIAAVDLNGNFAHAAHTPGGLESAVSIIEKWGTPSMVAVDVRPAPPFAMRLASSFNAPLFVPKNPWREGQKQKLLHHLSVEVENAHERDALSAAVMAYRANQNMLGPANSEKTITAHERDTLKHLLLSGIRHSIAFEMVAKKSAPSPQSENAPAAQPRIAAPTPERKITAEEFARTERANAELRKRNEFLEGENAQLRSRIKLADSSVRARMARDMEIARLRFEVQRLKNEIESARANARAKWKSHKGAPAQGRQNRGNAPSVHQKYVLVKGKGDTLKGLDEREGSLERLIQEYRKGRTGK